MIDTGNFFSNIKSPSDKMTLIYKYSFKLKQNRLSLSNDLNVKDLKYVVDIFFLQISHFASFYKALENKIFHRLTVIASFMKRIKQSHF